MRTRAFALVAFGVSLFAACEEGDIAVNGSGGAAAGSSGSAGKGGSSGSAGKGGTTGGSAGSNATGGGSGEAGSGEAGAGGTVGEAGSAGSSASGGAGESGAPSGAGGTNGDGDLCQMGCTATLAADCAQGPNSMRMCVSDCRDLLDGRCSEEYETLRTCAVGEEVTCGEMGFPIVEACSDEQSAFRDCMN